MSSQANKAIIQRLYEEGFNRGNLSVVDELFAPDFAYRTPTPTGEQGRDAIKQGIGLVRSAFPDIHYTIEDEVAEGDKVVAYWTAHGTHQATFLGIPANRQAGHV